jgi:hypothetical protein
MHAIQTMTSLKTLTLTSKYADMSIDQTFNENGIFRYLPRSLTALNLFGQDDLTDDCLMRAATRNDPSLKSLNLGGTEVTQTGLKNLAHMPLQHLALAECPNIENLNFLLNFPYLRTLDLTDVFPPECWEPLLQMPQLEMLKVYGTDIQNWACLVNLKNLTHLEISDATDNKVVHIKHLPISNLSFCGSNSELTDKGLQTLQAMPLAALILSYCHSITSAGLVVLKTVKKLSLVECDGITEKDVVILRSLPLEKLSISLCKHVADQTSSSVLDG